MSQSCSFKKVLIYGGMAFISSDSLSVAERFATSPVSSLDLPFVISTDFTRWMPVRRFAYYVRELLGVTSNEDTQSYFDLPFAPRTDISVVRYFLDSLGMGEYVHHLVFDDFWFEGSIHVFKK